MTIDKAYKILKNATFPTEQRDAIDTFFTGINLMAKELEALRGSQVLSAVQSEFIEPEPIKAGDKRILINGTPPMVDCRLIAEDNYQILVKRGIAG